MRGARRNRRVHRPAATATTSATTAATAAQVASRSTWDMLIWNHIKLWVAAIAGVVLVIATPAHWSWYSRLLTGWNAGAFILVPLVYLRMRDLGPQQLREKYIEDDPTAPVILLIVVAGALLSVIAIVALLSTVKQVAPAQRVFHLVLATMTIASSWLLVHTMFTIHYADMYYSTLDGEPPPLSFPDTAQPLFWDFVYFSFTIGVACQTADVSTRRTAIRRTVTVHSIIAFVFNLAILGFAINVSAGLLGNN